MTIQANIEFSKDDLRPLAAEIVAAYVTNNKMAASRLPAVIDSVYGSLARLRPEGPPEKERRAPRRSAGRDFIVCREDGKRFKSLKRHLAAAHGMTPEEYREKYGLADDYPMKSRPAAARGPGAARKAAKPRQPGAAPARAKVAPARAKKVGNGAAPPERRAKNDSGRAVAAAKAAGIGAKRGAVPIRRSIQADHIVCLEDGKRFKILKRHLRSEHGTTPEAYRARWGLPAHYPMVAPDYSARRAEVAKEIGLGRKPQRSKAGARP